MSCEMPCVYCLMCIRDTVGGSNYRPTLEIEIKMEG